MPTRSRISAGLLMFRRRKDKIEVLLAHPGGPLFVRKDDGVWTIPKGEAAPGEDLLTRAQIEFEEEVGFRPENVQEWIELGWIQQKGGKIVHAWAFEGDLPEPVRVQIKSVRAGMAAAFREIPKLSRSRSGVLLLRERSQTQIKIQAGSFS